MIKKILFLLTIMLMIPVNVQADVISIDDFEIWESIEVLKTEDYGNINYETIVDYLSKGEISKAIKYVSKVIYQNTIGNVVLVEKTIINLVIIILVSAFFTNFANVFSRDNISDTGFYICYLIIITFMVSLFEFFVEIASQYITVLLQFVSAILPGYFLSVAIFNQVTAIGFYEVIIVVIAVTQFLFLNIVLPLIKIYLAISLVNNISQEDLLSKTSLLISRLINTLNKGLLGLVTGINLVQSLILPSVDFTKNTTIKKLVGTLPVIGDGTEAVTNVLMGSANLIKNTIGVFAIVVIFIVCAIPYIKILLYSVTIQLATAVVQPIADSRITQSLGCFSTSMRMLLKVIVYNGLLFVISMAIVCVFTNG